MIDANDRGDPAEPFLDLSIEIDGRHGAEGRRHGCQHPVQRQSLRERHFQAPALNAVREGFAQKPQSLDEVVRPGMFEMHGVH